MDHEEFDSRDSLFVGGPLIGHTGPNLGSRSECILKMQSSILVARYTHGRVNPERNIEWDAWGAWGAYKNSNDSGRKRRDHSGCFSRIEGRDMSLIHSPVLSRGSAGMRTSVDGKSLRDFSTFLISDSGSQSPPALPITG